MNDAGFIAPLPDKAAMLAGLAVMFPDPNDVLELRAFYKGKKRTDAGYFDGEHRQKLVNEAARLNADGAAVYVTLNQIDPQLLSRYFNRIEQFAAATVTDANVIRRKLLLIDFDPVRPKDTSATDAQLVAAHQKAQLCFNALKDAGWPEPMAGQSGNGWHLLYPLDLPNDDASRDLVKGALAGLAARFNDDVVTVDQTVFNAGRITKLFGTVANKGDHTPLAPWRLSRLVLTPKRDAVVTVDQLRALHPDTAQPSSSFTSGGRRGGFDLPDFLSRLNIPYEQDKHEGRDRYKLEHCPFNTDHGKGEAAVFRDAGGVLGFKCQHNSCADKHWKDVRALLDGPREAREQRKTSASGHAGAEYQPGDGSASAGDPDGWPEPQPLPEGLPGVAQFDFALLPETLQPWARDICERVQCPPDYVAVTIMAALGAVIGRKIGIRPQERTDWIEYPNQWGLCVGRPGVLKSPAMEAALSPLKRLAVTASEAYRAAIDEYERGAKLAKLQAEAGEKAAKSKLFKNPLADVSGDIVDDELEVPTLKRYIANDTSAESLGELLRQNPNGLLVFRDELVSLLKGLDREENAPARGFYLTGWNGNSPYVFDRIGRGLNLHIPAVCLSMLGSTQPGRIAEYLRAAVKGGAGDDGMIQRFGLLVWPDTDNTWRDVDRWPDTEARHTASAVFERLDALDADAIGAQCDDFDKSRYLRFDGEGLALFREWREGWELKVRGGDLHPALESHLAKYRKLVPALALILHLANDATGPVSGRATLQALAWAEYLETHARRAYASVTSPETSAAKAIIEKLRKGELPRTFAARDIYRRGWAHLSERERVQDALRLLCDLDCLAMHTRDTEGRTATVYEANPKGFPV